ncbi:MAG: tetratricopeptide repeat protein [Desulfobacteraceae bacterium]|nr:MAG: tetratricopeptide repeat protein [Desulfobacteraceae bacterium]
MNDTKFQIFSQHVLFAAFLLIISMPSVFMLVTPRFEISKSEKRKLATLPQFSLSKQSLKELPAKLEAYLNDHFGYRDTHLFFNSYIKVKMLGISPVEKVVIGKENWLYLNDWRSIEDYMGLQTPQEVQLKAWKLLFEKRKKWLEKQGIAYLFVIVPDKQTIYPEYLPDYITKTGNQTRLDCLLEYLDGKFDENILDLRPAFLKAKHLDLLYYITDTHWNQLGAYLGYKEILERIRSHFPNNPGLVDLPIQKSYKNATGLDLANMINMEKFYKDFSPVIALPEACAKLIKNEGLPQLFLLEGKMPFSRGCDKSDLRAVIFRDSFSESIILPLSEHFKEIVYIWHPYDQNAMNELTTQSKPDIVIEECAEMVLLWHYPIVKCHNIIGNDFLEKGETQKAIIEFEKVLKLYPEHPDALNNIGFALMKERKLAKAIHIFKSVLNNYPDHVQTKDNLRVATQQLNQINRTIQTIKSKFELEPKNHTLHYQLGQQYYRKGDAEAAVLEYRKAIELKTDYADAIYNLAILFAEHKEYNKAISLFNALTALTPDNLSIYYNIACMYAGQYRPKEAVAWLEKAVRKGYNNWNLIKTDKDLSNIRNSLQFKNFIQKNDRTDTGL